MWTLQDAKNQFSAVVAAALAGQPQRVTRRGREAVVVVSAAQFDRLRRAAGAGEGSFVDHLLAIPSGETVAGDAEAEAPARVTPRDVAF
ncbi:type II toxin-antitoxin system Phd/YefM family antitoxin [Amaricoccus sp. W119]|uniref:type II toxin-antitoxin system Phd/YefM family antitoxin n=1 Tax=Amaricoccus sp. W119 TaxID=3391833 RepID=UPI0039A5C186